MAKYADVLLNVAHISIFGAVAAMPSGCDARHVIRATSISQAKVYRDLKTLTDARLIDATRVRTGAGYEKTTYKARYNKITIVMYRGSMSLDLETV